MTDEEKKKKAKKNLAQQKYNEKYKKPPPSKKGGLAGFAENMSNFLGTASLSKQTQQRKEQRADLRELKAAGGTNQPKAVTMNDVKDFFSYDGGIKRNMEQLQKDADSQIIKNNMQAFSDAEAAAQARDGSDEDKFNRGVERQRQEAQANEGKSNTIREQYAPQALATTTPAPATGDAAVSGRDQRGTQQALAAGSAASANIASSLVKDNGNDYLNQRYDPTQFTPEMQAPLAPLNQQRGKDGRVMPTDFRGQSPSPPGARSSRNYTLQKNMFERNERLEARKDFANELTDNGFDMSTASKDDKKNAYARAASLGVSRKQLDNFLNPKEADRPGQQSTASGKNSKPQGDVTRGENVEMGSGVVKQSDPVEQGDILGVPNRGRGGTNTYGSTGVQGSRGLSNQRESLNSPSRLAPSQFGTRGASQVRGETNGPGGASGLTSGSERTQMYTASDRQAAKNYKKKSRASHLAYRQKIREGDREGALKILNESGDRGITFGGVSQSGAALETAKRDRLRKNQLQGGDYDKNKPTDKYWNR